MSCQSIRTSLAIQKRSTSSFGAKDSITLTVLYVPGAGFSLLRFLLRLFNRLVLLVEQLACAFRRLAGDVLHRHALPEIGLVVRRGEVGGDLQIRCSYIRLTPGDIALRAA